MRSHGWSGNAPASDEEAIERILDAAEKLATQKGSAPRIADVARQLGVTRPTVYRYFSSSENLLVACAIRSADGLLDNMVSHLSSTTDPVHALVEGVAFAVETLADDPQLGSQLQNRSDFSKSGVFISETSKAFARSMLHRLHVDWPAHAYSEADLGELAEFLLRTMQSLLADPGEPPRNGTELRRYLQRWMGPVIEYPKMVRALAALRELQVGGAGS
ncbi:TetR/AcrR family transcriptional regulator [Mycobacterium sp. 94-17]|uniref:TetR/AcrR family transcriptional regulator n=1 Tax=Mycobacterium sp. 94-17 TaxID=2986147 RepID=UPI002D1F08A0|nr:TetR/AcrR family transcriptional regulator [Mycobacterium sp. 94-17]MEB4209551.1 TetR/AcrR family transcriptional regulator [Mycobacterium sp. 94-17]